MNPAIEIATAQTNTEKLKTSSTRVENRRVIFKEELNKRIQAGEAIQIVNVLDPSNYGLGFIKGSRKIPFEKLDARAGELDRARPVITYCASSDCPASKMAAEKLSAMGYSARAYEGGIKEWKEAGLPTEI